MNNYRKLAGGVPDGGVPGGGGGLNDEIQTNKRFFLRNAKIVLCATNIEIQHVVVNEMRWQVVEIHVDF